MARHLATAMRNATIHVNEWKQMNELATIQVEDCQAAALVVCYSCGLREGELYTIYRREPIIRTGLLLFARSLASYGANSSRSSKVAFAPKHQLFMI
jgi:hypothetical protein